MTEPSFLLDGMLGSLARWLRIMGYDSVYMRNEDDLTLLSIRGDRYLLTRDRQLAQRAGSQGLFIESDKLDVQLSAVVKRFGLRFDIQRTRCTACNGRLEKVAKELIKDRVAAGTYDEIQEFWMCQGCGKVFWHGAHWKNIGHRLDGLS